MPRRSKATRTLVQQSASDFMLGVISIAACLFVGFVVYLLIAVTHKKRRRYEDWHSTWIEQPEKARPVTLVSGRNLNEHGAKYPKPRNPLNITELARRLDLPATDLQTAPVDYAQRHIPKRRGGTRQLQVPNQQLKHLQRRILRRLLKRLRAHPAAVGFEPGLSIAHNAGMHIRKAVVIKMDIVDFFPSTKTSRVEWYFRRIGWDAETATLLTKLTTHDGGLPQGAPTSPRLSNLVNHVMDAQIQRRVQRYKGTYTRYADDITISFPKDYPKHVRGTIQGVRRIAKKHGYTIHVRHKLRVVRRHQQQRVTGLVVNEKVQLPREKRRWLRAVEHRMKTTGRASLTPEQLAGWKALQAMIERQTGRDPDARRDDT